MKTTTIISTLILFGCFFNFKTGNITFDTFLICGAIYFFVYWPLVDIYNKLNRRDLTDE